jgi:hypothetical protein
MIFRLFGGHQIMLLGALLLSAPGYADRVECSPSSSDDYADEVLKSSSRLVSECEAFALTIRKECESGITNVKKEVTFAEANRAWMHCLNEYNRGIDACGVEGMQIVKSYEILAAQTNNPRFCELASKVKKIDDNIKLAQFAAREAGRAFDQQRRQFADLMARLHGP